VIAALASACYLFLRLEARWWQSLWSRVGTHFRRDATAISDLATESQPGQDVDAMGSIPNQQWCRKQKIISAETQTEASQVPRRTPIVPDNFSGGSDVWSRG